MARTGVLCVGLLLAAVPAWAAELRFWNLTNVTVTGLFLAPAGSGRFGADQCANDRDGEVDHDERLRLSGVEPGRYDVRVRTKAGQVCTVPNVEVKGTGRYAFSLENADLKDCAAVR